MAISVNWPTGVISIPKSDTILTGTDPITGREIRTYDTIEFHKQLRSALEAEDGRSGFPNTHSHDPETIIDGVNYAAKITMNEAYYTVEFENGNYRVVLINTNNNIAGVAIVNNVSVQPTNSAGLVGSDDLRSQSFLNASVYLDLIGGFSGVAYPIGTPKKKSNNITDSISIANSEGLSKINLTGFLSITNSIDISSLKIEGGTGSGNIVALAGGGNNMSDFEKLIVVGQLNGLARFRNCILGTTGLGGVTGIQGRIVDCIINHPTGVVQQAGGAGTLFENCSFISPDYPKVTVNANGEGLGMRNCNGNILLTNYTKSETNLFHFVGGTIEIDATCTAGTIVIEGTCTVIDNSNGTTVVDNVITSTDVTFIKSVLEGDVVPTPSQFQILDRISKAVLVQKNANEVNGLTQLTE